uniref:Odorant receptor n=1 Tax=Lutzomyia longipalpis TaxID=7200 RepID=A0A3F2ZDC2_LUTLO
MFIKESREKFENLAGKLKSIRKYSALISSEEFYEKYRKYLIVIPIILEVLTLVPLATKLFNEDEEGEMFASVILILLAYTQGNVKILLILLNVDGIDEIIQWFHSLHQDHENELISKVYDENLRKIVNIVKWAIRIITIGYGLGATCIALFYMTTNQLYFKVPFIEESQKLAHRLAGPFTVYYNTLSVYLTDSTMIFIGIYFVGALDILNDLIGKFNESTNIPSVGILLPKIISLHFGILDKFGEFCEIFKFILFFELIDGTGFLLFNFYLIAQSENYLFFWSTFTCVYSQFVLFCLFGQIISNKSERIFTDLYLTKWYEMEIKDQKAILLMMKISQNEFGLKAGGMYDIDLILLVNVTKLCFSCTAIYHRKL